MEEAYGFLPVLLLRESDALARTKVEDIMTKNIKTVPEDITVSQFLDLIGKYHHIAYPVINKTGEPIGIATLEEAAKVEQDKRKDTLVKKITRRNLIVAHSGDTALDAFKKMEKHEVGRVLVLDPANPKNLLGMVTKTDLMRILTNNVADT
jgi:CIC family chloride channel protein